MLNFSIDYFNKDYFFSDYDYSNKIILNAVSDPLFIYSKKHNDYVKNACKKYSNNHNKKYVITIRDDLFYNNGLKVLIDDYIASLQKIMNSNNNINIYYQNIKSILKIDNKTMVIVLKKRDKNFIKKLTLYTITPIKNKMTSGRYYIKTINKDCIKLVPNLYYRNKANEGLNFKIVTSLNDNNTLFDKRLLDITNNTFVSLLNEDKGFLNKEYSNIIYSIELSTKIPLFIRKKIVNSINKNNIVSKLGKNYFIKNDFFPNTKSKYHYKSNTIDGNKMCLRIAYNDFYPNEIIAKLIQNELISHNFVVELYPYSYGNYLSESVQKCEIKLVLNYFEFIDQMYFYESKYFSYIMKNDSLYSIMLKCNKKIVNYLFRKKYIKEPMLSFYSRYYTNNKTKDYSFLECNFNKLK